MSANSVNYGLEAIASGAVSQVLYEAVEAGMNKWMRLAFLALWLAGATWLLRVGAFGTLGFCLASAAGLLVAGWRPAARRRRGELRYVEMAKQPVGQF